MRRMLPVVISFVFLGSSAPQVLAQAVPPAKAVAAPAETPSVQEILDRYVSALGGRAAIEKLTSRVLKGRVEYTSLDLKGEVEIASKAPDKARLTFYFPGGVVEEGYDGTVAWEAPIPEVVRTLRGERAAESKIDSQFYADLRIAELFPQLKVVGTEAVDGRPAYVVEGVPAEGNRRWFYFDVKTGLLVRHDFEGREASLVGRYSTYLRDYRAIDGVKLPMTIQQKGEGVDWTIRFTTVQHNVPLDDARFKKPKAVAR